MGPITQSRSGASITRDSCACQWVLRSSISNSDDDGAVHDLRLREFETQLPRPVYEITSPPI